MLAEEVRHRLRQSRLHECVVAGTEYTHEQLDIGDLASLWIADARLLAGVVDEQLFAGPMYLPHAEPTSVAPVRVQLTELAVLIRLHTALLGSRFVLAPQQLQRDTDAAQLSVKPLEVDRGPCGWLAAPHVAEQPRFDLGVAERLSLRPAEPSARSAAQVVADRGWRHLARQRDLAVLAAALVVKTKNLSNLAHGQSPHGPRPSPPSASAARPTLIECPEWLIE